LFLHEIKSGAKVFIDANIFVYHFSKGSEFNKSCTDFLYRAETSQIHGFTSTGIINDSDFKCVDWLKLHLPASSE
jgi:hypothetical protein